MKKLICLIAILALSFQIWAYRTCKFDGAGGVSTITVHFEDPDEDCKSNNYETFHTMTNGTVVHSDWPEPGQEGAWGTLDFNKWGCCIIASQEPAQEY